jgi:hypothetical protein
MIWVTGTNATSGTYIASGGNFGSVVENMEINCNDNLGCGNVFAVGRQEKSRLHNLLLTGGVPFSGGYSYGVYEQGVDCNNTYGTPNSNTPPLNGCLVYGDGNGNPMSGQQGPDDLLEIFPSYNVTSANFIPFAEMGANNYKGLLNSTINGLGYSIPHGLYFWGEETTMGPGVHEEGVINGPYIGNIPAGTSCNGGSQVLFTGFDLQITIANCGAQQNLSFTNDAGGVSNLQTGAPQSTITDTNYFYDQQTQTSGWLGSKSAGYSNNSIVLKDPGEYAHNGYGGLDFFNGNPHSGVNAQPLLDSNSLSMRGHYSSNAWWNHGTGQWNLGGNGGTDYGSVGFLNDGTCFSNATAVTSPFTMATYFGNCLQFASQAGHFLVGSGWINTATGRVQGEGSAAFQVTGDIGSGTINPGPQFAQASATTCPTAATAGSTCTFTVPWSVSYANTTYPVVCSLLEATGAATIHGVTRSTGSVSVVVQNGTASQAVASGASGAACWAQP